MLALILSFVLKVDAHSFVPHFQRENSVLHLLNVRLFTFWLEFFAWTHFSKDFFSLSYKPKTLEQCMNHNVTLSNNTKICIFSNKLFSVDMFHLFVFLSVVFLCCSCSLSSSFALSQLFVLGTNNDGSKVKLTVLLLFFSLVSRYSCRAHLKCHHFVSVCVFYICFEFHP